MLSQWRRYEGVAVPCVLMAGTAIAYLEAGTVEQLGLDPLGAAFFPQLLAAMIFVLAAIELARAVWQIVHTRASGEMAVAPLDTVAIVRAIACFAAFVALCLTIRNNWMPFPLSGVVFMAACGLIYIEKFTRLRVLAMGSAALILPIAIDYVFQTFFYVSIP